MSVMWHQTAGRYWVGQLPQVLREFVRYELALPGETKRLLIVRKFTYLVGSHITEIVEYPIERRDLKER